MRYFIELSYNGKSYRGWQVQKNAHTVQQELNESLTKCLGSPVECVGSGRTDAGVHARQQFCHIDLDRVLDMEKSMHQLNAVLPKDIAIHHICQVPKTAHARFDAISRSYEYHIHRDKDPFAVGISYFFRQHLLVDQMNLACELIMGEHDFASFCKSRNQLDHFRCTITQAHWIEDNGRYCFYVSANRFLRGMVRALVGTLMEVGTGKISIPEFHKILDSRDRRKAGRSVPAHGLVLAQVLYPESLLAQE